MRTIECVVLKREAEALDFPSYPGDWRSSDHQEFLYKTILLAFYHCVPTVALITQDPAPRDRGVRELRKT